jgi:amidase
MLHRVGAERIAYSFDRRLQPVLEIRSGDEVVFETLDARAGRVMTECDEYVVRPPQPLERMNPVSGPVGVRGAQGGDTLLVEIEDIRLGAKGYSAVRRDMGILKDMVQHPGVTIIGVKEDRILFNDRISLPTRPMIGTIGVAPPSQGVPSAYPGPHGGNMDCNDVAVGAKVFLPVYAEGALFALGDVHASMGDAEISGGGLEIAADVKVKITLLRHIHLDTLLVETERNIIIVHNSKTVEEAIRGVVLKSVRLLIQRMGLSFEDAYRVASTVGDVRICQACASSIDAVVRMRIPKLFGIEDVETVASREKTI